MASFADYHAGYSNKEIGLDAGQKKMKKLSAIIACYGDGPAILIMYGRLRAAFHRIGVAYEIIFVNDASPDNAREILQELAMQDKHVVVINHARNFGSQAAFTSGMRIATGDAVVLLDGDLQDPPELIPDFYDAWLQGNDVVYGIRQKRETTFFMGIAYRTFYRIFSTMSYVKIPLDAGDFSLIDRRVVDVLNSLPESNRFIRGMRAWTGFRQTGVPYFRPERKFGRTTNNFFKNVGWARKAILSFSYMPVDFIAWFGFLSVAISVLAILCQITLRLLVPDLVQSGFTTLIVLILFMGGLQTLCLSVIGSYIAHIYDEVKRRPPYVVESILNAPTQATPVANEEMQHQNRPAA